MFAHPRCPCTLATLERLNHILAQSRGNLAVQIWLWTPQPGSDEWQESRLSRQARDLPGVLVRQDRNGEEADRFGAATSGYVLLYDKTGQLLFSGGISGSRGHAAENPNEDKLLALLRRESHRRQVTSVYGCPLN